MHPTDPYEGHEMARRMMTERMLAIAPIVVAIAAGTLVAMLMPSTTMTVVTFILTAVVVLWLAVRGR
jgi:hypothetical protein